MTVEQLTEEERGSWLRGLTGWSLARDGKAIVRSFEFADFSEAFAFMTRVAMIAETRDASGLSLRDVKMARKIDALLG
jgi:4a-hydroxytetrahydrobiopterin dehydratase